MDYENQRTALDMLHEATDEKELKITLIIGEPRTCTTALANALGNSKQVGANAVFHEVFNNMATERLIERLPKLLQDDKKQHFIVLKEMADTAELIELASMADHIIFTVREPIQRAFAYIDDKTSESKGMANLSLAGHLRKYDVNLNRKTLALDTPGSITDGIAGAMNRVDLVNTKMDKIHASLGENAPTMSIVDAEHLRIDPVPVLQKLCKRSGIPYRQEMAHGWREKYDIYGEPWGQAYKQSNKIERPTQSAPYVEGMYDKINYPFLVNDYMEMMSKPELVRSPFSKIFDVMRRQCPTFEPDTKVPTRIAFDDLCPPSAYAIVSSYMQLDEPLREKQQHYLQELRSRHAEHIPAFDAIDAWVKEHTAQPNIDASSAQITGRTGQEAQGPKRN